LIRIPDVAFVRWDRVPGRRLSRKAIADMAPDLAIEVLSEGNTPREMTRKLRDYFSAGVSRVWFIDLDRREVSDYSDPVTKTVYSEHQSIDGGELLPGFTLELTKLFAKFDRLCDEH
jgi:Uma2 family endonuclease